VARMEGIFDVSLSAWSATVSCEPSSIWRTNAYCVVSVEEASRSATAYYITCDARPAGCSRAPRSP
jgi:hypothetical protein